MKKSNYVIFKGRKDGITVLLDRDVDFDLIKSTLHEKMADAKGFFMNGKAAITFKGRDLSEDEEQELLNIITSETDLSITFAQSVNTDQTRVAPTENAAPAADGDVFTRTIEEFGVNTTIFRTESLRSGQSVRFNGSVVVVGDVNPGAEIVAEGNVVVLGKLMGLAHAGCSGCPDCFVAALRMQPVQLRIGDKITYFPKNFTPNDAYAARPLFAFVRDGQINITPMI